MSSVDDRIQSLIDGSKVLLFMKGNRAIPMCGFSAAVIQVLDRTNVPYQTVDVLQDSEIREGVKSFSNWPTIPQLYVGGKFVGDATSCARWTPGRTRPIAPDRHERELGTRSGDIDFLHSFSLGESIVAGPGEGPERARSASWRFG
jgi:monothiol glutaredoxin